MPARRLRRCVAATWSPTSAADLRRDPPRAPGPVPRPPRASEASPSLRTRPAGITSDSHAFCIYPMGVCTEEMSAVSTTTEAPAERTAGPQLEDRLQSLKALTWLLPVVSGLTLWGTLRHQPDPNTQFADWSEFVTTRVFLVQHLTVSIAGQTLFILERSGWPRRSSHTLPEAGLLPGASLSECLEAAGSHRRLRNRRHSGSRPSAACRRRVSPAPKRSTTTCTPPSRSSSCSPAHCSGRSPRPSWPVPQPRCPQSAAQPLGCTAHRGPSSPFSVSPSASSSPSGRARRGRRGPGRTRSAQP